MKIALILNGRYPTDKAYGVTSKATYSSLSKKGHEVNIFAFSPKKASNLKVYENIQYFPENIFLKLIRKCFELSNKYVSKAAWLIYNYNFINWTIKEINKNNYQLAWGRNFTSCRVAERAKIKLVLEIHSPLSTRQLSEIAKNRKLILLAPISKSLHERCIATQAATIYSPMGFYEKNLPSQSEITLYVNDIKKIKKRNITYIGKLYPGGFSKGVETLVSIAKYIENNNAPFFVRVIGGNENELVRFRNLIKEKNIGYSIEIIGQVEHTKTQLFQKSADFIIVTESKQPGYSGFPLKSIEAVSSGKIVLAEDCQILKDVFLGNFNVVWFSPENISNMFLSLEQLITDDNLNVKLLKNIENSRPYTWEKRASNILSHDFFAKSPESI